MRRANFLAGKDARMLARELLAMAQEEFSVAFRGSPMKRAKLQGLKRNAAVVLGNIGTGDDVDAPSQLEPPVCFHDLMGHERFYTPDEIAAFTPSMRVVKL